MSRQAVTAGLSALLERHLSGGGRPWAKEVTIRSLGNVRPDYVSVRAHGGGLAAIDKIECAEVSVYEVKSCMADFKSGSGLNAVGDVNWLVLPYRLHREIVLSDEQAVPNYFGTAWPVPCGWRPGDMSALVDYEGQVDGWGLHWAGCTSPRQHFGRKAPLVEFLWSMMYAGVRRYA